MPSKKTTRTQKKKQNVVPKENQEPETSLIQGTFDDVKFFKSLDLNSDLEFSIKMSYEEVKESKLRNLMNVAINRFKKVWKACNLLEVNYNLQKDGSDLGSKYFDYDEIQLDRYLRKMIKYWKGDRKPEGVFIEDAWKCRGGKWEF
ncbi:exonuclease V-like isoform X2 [Rhizophagus clarus]|uniref:Exonuclease V-like isoform X2 n=1 Tax=Rhizophagus clarus TaxID=94130 RepID=A0A8H3QI78_9GLOM|nr:exonuclease V-like isoform X2 [Rhizophagus clarus]